MSVPIILEDSNKLPLHHRFIAHLVVGAARLLALLPPRRIRTVLTHLRAGATPATYDQASAARRAVVSVSVLCAGKYCLQRSLATVMLCRLWGVWPTWCSGVITTPFAAHAWVEVDGRPVEEPFHPGQYHILMKIGATS